MSETRISNEVVVEGWEEVEKKLTDLDAKLSRKIVAAALRAGAKVTYGVTRQLTPELTGFAVSNLKVRAAKYRKNYVAILVGWENSGIPATTSISHSWSSATS
jgi:hypothetical protein